MNWIVDDGDDSSGSRLVFQSGRIVYAEAQRREVVSVHTEEGEREGGIGKTGSRGISIVKILKAMRKIFDLYNHVFVHIFLFFSYN